LAEIITVAAATVAASMDRLARHNGSPWPRAIPPAGATLSGVIPGEDRNVSAFWDVDPNGDVLARDQIVTLARRSRFRLDTNDRVVLLKSASRVNTSIATE
jgi:hypothetical protein